MSSTKVIVVGAGIAGPLVASFLKQKGYDPVLYERTESVSMAGLSLCLQPNGLRVLSKAPGLVEKFHGHPLDTMAMYSVLPEDRGLLAENDIGKRVRAVVGLGLVGVRRPMILKALTEHAEEVGVPIKWGHKLVGLEQHEDSVTVTFANGATDTGSFVIGCDGLHSNTRICLFGEQPADFTGLTQCGGISPLPDEMKGKSAMVNVFGNGVHMIAYQVNDREVSWATTRREAEAKETWRAMDEAAVAEFKRSPVFEEWDAWAKEIIKGGTNVTKYGLYDRPELKTWHVGRVLLIGDAAHPTSPHLGQGANQAFEDVNLLLELLEKHNPGAGPPSTPTLEMLFTELEAIRIPKSSAMVRGARAQGESRVVQGVEACKARNDALRAQFRDPEAVFQVMAKAHASSS